MKQQNIGRKLIRLRISKDFSYEMICGYLNIPINDYVEIENGEKDITIEQLIILSELFKVKIHSILFIAKHIS
jgi:transcriptional regulator with XRE-family HTH domain